MFLIILSILLVLLALKLIYIYSKRKTKDKHAVRMKLNPDGSIQLGCHACGYESIVPNNSTVHWCENIHKPCNKLIFNNNHVVQGAFIKVRQ